jgi:hypothetical protein
LLDPEIALQSLRLAADDPIAQQQLRRIVYEQVNGRPMDRLRDISLLNIIGGWLAEGRPGLADLELRELPVSARGIASETPAPVEEAEGPAAERKTETYWVRFQIVDDDTNDPLPNIRLRIRAPGRGSREYTTDGEGVIYLDGLPDGVCDIEQMLDDDAFEVVRVE